MFSRRFMIHFLSSGASSSENNIVSIAVSAVRGRSKVCVAQNQILIAVCCLAFVFVDLLSSKSARIEVWVTCLSVRLR